MENGWYHVMNRGIDGRQLFPDNEANEHFRELLARMPTRFGLRIRAYVLMGDHYHLQIETLRPNLSRAIQWLNLHSVLGTTGYITGAAHFFRGVSKQSCTTLRRARS